MGVFLLDDAGITDVIRGTLRRAHGVAAAIEDVSHVTQTVILAAWGQRQITLTSACDMLCDMGATTDEAIEAMQICYDVAQLTMLPVLRQHVDLNRFEVDVRSDFTGNVRVNTKPKSEMMAIERVLSEYHASVANGDYYPERIRHALGDR